MTSIAKTLFLASASFAAAGEMSPPWQTDVRAARASALKEGKPCVLIVHVDAPAL